MNSSHPFRKSSGNVMMNLKGAKRLKHFIKSNFIKLAYLTNPFFLFQDNPKVKEEKKLDTLNRFLKLTKFMDECTMNRVEMLRSTNLVNFIEIQVW